MNIELANQALRTICCAYKEIQGDEGTENVSYIQ